MISFQIKPWVAFGFPYLLIELFYIGMPVVRTDGRSLARCTVTWLPNFLGWVDYHISLAMGLCPRVRFARGWSSAMRTKGRSNHCGKTTRKWNSCKKEAYSHTLQFPKNAWRTKMHDRCLSSCELYTMSLLQLNVKITACKYIAVTRQDR